MPIFTVLNFYFLYIFTIFYQDYSLNARHIPCAGKERRKLEDCEIALDFATQMSHNYQKGHVCRKGGYSSEC